MHLYDLHCHSTASDGILSPETLVSRAKSQGVTHLALTDHDTTDGLSLAKSAGLSLGVNVIPGIELSTQWSGINVHIVGLNVDIEAPVLKDAVMAQSKARHDRAQEIDQRFKKLGIEGVFDGAQKYAGNASIGRPHMARYLVEQGLVKDMNQAFKKYLGAGKLGDVKQVWLELGDVVRAITDSGGIAVLAHPLKYKMTLTKLRLLVSAFKQVGGQAIEVVSGDQQANQTQSMGLLANRFELFASCGSDFHTPEGGFQELGRYSPMPSDVPYVWSHPSWRQSA